jgi:uncharacterized protein YgbK (DUF1537 family)
MTLLGVIADDFTGASDIASMLVESGMNTVLISGVPPRQPAPSDAAVIALKSRSIAAADAVAQSLAALSWLKGRGCRQIVFKYCSTFDSTPKGNIGPVASALADALGASKVICCPAFPANGRTVYQGHLFVGDTLLSQSGMERHPLNPMREPNIRRWMQLQCEEPVGLIPHAVVRQGAMAIVTALAAAPERLLIADATSDADLMALGAAAADAALVTGGSGIAKGLPENFRKQGLLEANTARFQPRSGPAIVLAGSCSPATLRQVAAYRTIAPAITIDIAALMAKHSIMPNLLDFALEHRGQAPMLYSSAPPDILAETQSRFGAEAVSAALDRLSGELAKSLAAAGFARLVIAGGETSGAAVTALGAGSFIVGPEIAPGVPCLLADTRPPIVMALKSGNFGADDFFARAVSMLGGGTS